MPPRPGRPAQASTGQHGPAQRAQRSTSGQALCHGQEPFSLTQSSTTSGFHAEKLVPLQPNFPLPCGICLSLRCKAGASPRAPGGTFPPPTFGSGAPSRSPGDSPARHKAPGPRRPRQQESPRAQASQGAEPAFPGRTRFTRSAPGCLPAPGLQAEGGISTQIPEKTYPTAGHSSLAPGERQSGDAGRGSKPKVLQSPAKLRLWLAPLRWGTPGPAGPAAGRPAPRCPPSDGGLGGR